MNRRTLQKLILEELGAPRRTAYTRPRRLSLIDYLDESSDRHLMSIDDNSIISTGRRLDELGDEFDITTAGAPREEEEPDVSVVPARVEPPVSPAPTSVPVPEPDPYDEAERAAAAARAASSEREEEIAARGASATPAAAGAAPPQSEDNAPNPTPDPFFSILTRGAAGESERRKKGKGPSQTQTQQPQVVKVPDQTVDAEEKDVDNVETDGDAENSDVDGLNDDIEDDEAPPKVNNRIATRFIDDEISSYVEPSSSMSEDRRRRLSNIYPKRHR